MKQLRRQHSAEFKSKVAIEALKEQKTLSQISEQYSLHATQINDWNKVYCASNYVINKSTNG